MLNKLNRQQQSKKKNNSTYLLNVQLLQLLMPRWSPAGLCLVANSDDVLYRHVTIVANL